MASEADFLVLRRFDQLNIRVLLSLQDDLSVLEEKLGNIEQNCAAKGSKDIHNGSRRSDQVPERLELIASIIAKIEEYSKSDRCILM